MASFPKTPPIRHRLITAFSMTSSHFSSCKAESTCWRWLHQLRDGEDGEEEEERGARARSAQAVHVSRPACHLVEFLRQRCIGGSIRLICEIVYHCVCPFKKVHLRLMSYHEGKRIEDSNWLISASRGVVAPGWTSLNASIWPGTSSSLMNW